jgi:hypothetical protein
VRLDDAQPAVVADAEQPFARNRKPELGRQRRVVVDSVG